MHRSTFSFEGLETLEDRLAKLTEEVVYITITDRSDRDNEEQLARIQIDETHLLSYFVPDAPPPSSTAPSFGDDEDDETDDPDDAEEDIDDSDDESEDPEDGGTLAGAMGGGYGNPLRARAVQQTPQIRPKPPSREALIDASCRWIRDVAIRNTIGEPWRRFRVKSYGPKGLNCLDTGTFVCRNHAYQDDTGDPDDTERAVAPVTPVAPPSFDVAAMSASAKGVKTLGDLYSQWGHLVLGTVGQLQGINNSMNARLHKQLDESQTQVEQLVASILEFRASQVEAEETRQAATHQDDVRSALARDALQQLGEAARAFVTTRGLSPEMGDVLAILGASPELMAALKDPTVQELLRDPANLQLVAGMLVQFGQQAQAARTASGQVNPDQASEQPENPASTHSTQPPPTGEAQANATPAM